jgi:hypothetical protein
MIARSIFSSTLGVAWVAILLVSWPLQASAWNGIQAWTDGFEDVNATGWTVTQNGAAVSFDGSTANTGTYSLKITGASGAGQFAHLQSRRVRIDLTRDYTVQCAFRYEDFHWNRFLIFGHIRLLLDYPTLPVLYDPVGNNSFIGNRVCEESFESYLAAERWGWVTVHCRPTLRQYDVFINGAHMGTVDYQATVSPRSTLWFEDNGSSGNFLDAWYDDFSVWGFHDPELCSFALAVTCGSPPDVENDSTVWAAPPLVPYHGQYWHQQGHPLNEPCSPPRGATGNGRCFCACLHMIFDRFGDNLPMGGAPNRPGPQEEIEAAANTNDRVNCPNGNWHGTTLTDIRRGAHFSSAAVPAAPTAIRNGCPPAGCPQVGGGPTGYSWRDLGYAAVESVWTDLAPEDADDMELHNPPLTLETFLASGYPIIALIASPDGYCDSLKTSDKDCEVEIEDTQVDGHAVVIIGYDNTGAGGCEPYANHLGRPAFMVHDPAVAKFAWIDMQFFWDEVWTSKRFLFAAPWELMWLSPSEWCYNADFDGSLLSIYPGPPPLDGFYTVCGAKAKLALTTIGLPDDEVLKHNLNNTNATGDWDFSTWALKAPARIQGFNMVGTIKYEAWATLNPSPVSTSYPGGYKDDLGNEGSLTKQISMCITASGVDPGHFGWPYSDRWWHRTSGGSGLKLVAQGGPSYEVFATVGNNGGEPIPPGTFLRLFWEDPGAATRAPGLEYIAEIELPPLEYGDTLTVGPIPWTAPPYNSFGEPYFTILSEIDCPEDPIESEWPQAENNVAVPSPFSATSSSKTTPASPRS